MLRTIQGDRRKLRASDFPGALDFNRFGWQLRSIHLQTKSICLESPLPGDKLDCLSDPRVDWHLLFQRRSIFRRRIFHDQSIFHGSDDSLSTMGVTRPWI
jgi:hypothetical protein